jgi:NodT family efflux transporter outer membrane factor (OMF) lipoprotein
VNKRLLALLIAASLAGCTSGPDYVRPAVEVPLAFKEQWKPATAATANPTWWKALGDATLDDLEQQVEISNQNLKAAEAAYRAARAVADVARAGQSLSVSGKAAAAAGKADSYELSAAVSWELDLWGSLRRQVEAAEARAQASADDLAAARLSIQVLLAQTYVQLRAADAQSELYQRTVADYARFLELTRNRLAAGVASPLDVAQAETQLASAQAQLIDLHNQRAQLEHAIAALVGKLPAALSVTTDVRLPTLPPVPALIPSGVLESRPDIAAAERRMAAANAGIGVADAAFYPVVNLGAGLGYRGASFANLLTSPNYFWSLGPALAATLFDGGARKAGVLQAGASYDQAVANYRQTVLTAFQEVEDNLAAAHLLEQESAAQARALAAAKRAREIAENQYKAGVNSALNVITAQTAELSATASSVSIASRRLQAALQLLKNTGGGLAP